MGVMETIRKGTDSTLMKILFGIIVLVFVFWGVGTSNLGGQQSQTIAEVNGRRVTDTEYHRVMRSASRGNTSLDEDQVNELARKVIADLIQKEVLLQEAERLDIEVSDEEIARYVLNFNDFKGADGKFDKRLYERTLKRNGLTQGRFEMQVREELTLQKLMDIALASVRVSDVEARRRFVVDGTRVELDYVVVPDAALLDDVTVDDASVQAMVASGDPRIQERYDADFDRLYNQPRKASFSVILLRTDIEGVEEGAVKTRADAVAAEAAAGADFATLARTWSEDLTAVNGGVVGLQAEPQMDPAVARAVFETGAGAISEPVETGRGFQIVKVDSVEDAQVIPIESVKDEIARTIIAQDKVAQVAGQYAERILAEWKATGTAPEAVLTEQGLSTVSTGPFAPVYGEVPTLGPNPAVLDALDSVTAPGVLDGVYPTAGGRLVGAVTAVTVPGDEDYDANATMARARLTAAEQSSFIEVWRRDLVSRARIKQLYNP